MPGLIMIGLMPLATLSCGDDTAAGGGGTGGSSEGPSIACDGETCSYCCNFGACADEDTCWQGADEAGRTILMCDGSEDCDDGLVCCAGTPGGSFAIIADCQTGAECANLPLPIFFCHSADECAVGQDCLPWPDASYVSTCQ